MKFEDLRAGSCCIGLQDAETRLSSIVCIEYMVIFKDQGFEAGDCLQAVKVIHKARIVHSDLKPPNFLVVEGTLKLIDFGIAKAIQNGTTSIARESQCGTLNYMAPEAVYNGMPSLMESNGGLPKKVPTYLPHQLVLEASAADLDLEVQLQSLVYRLAGGGASHLRLYTQMMGYP